MILSFVSCKKPAAPKEEAVIEKLTGAGELQSRLAQIPATSTILVEHELKSLLSPKAKTAEFKAQEAAYYLPDMRVDPVSADYVLAYDSLTARSLCAPPNPPWKYLGKLRVAEGKSDIVLLQRVAPAKQLLADEETLKKDLRGLDEEILVEQDDPSNQFETSDFYIDKYEVTHAQYVRYLGALGADPKTLDALYSLRDPSSRIVFNGERYSYYNGSGRLPVFNVSWYGAEAYCRYYKKDLPTLAQWRKASGWTRGQKYPWTEEVSFDEAANLAGDKDGYEFWAPADAFKKGRSPYGVFNMSGNMYEWLKDNSLVGGSWIHGPDLADQDRHDSNYPIARNLHDGFRCVRLAR